ncbi:MAG: Type 1 glutamine amidotransferase-like domain-containing protein [Patescibacteria group bacterium]|nr:Type 1 glutamine amidotransferase-like domain-containing protein [Patescibacteria group bacterium]
MKIVAIGGGEIGRPGYPVETTKIDRKIVRLSGKKKPRLLFIPTASSDSLGYAEAVKKHFGGRLGCRVDALFLIRQKPSHREIRDKVMKSDIIYVGGGNTLKMMNIWRRYGVDDLLMQAAKEGIVLSGLSAGAICWFRWGSSDSRKFKDPKAKFIRVTGLGIIPALFCPHYDHEKSRRPDLKRRMRRNPGIAIAADNCAAIEIVDGAYRIISSKNKANAYKVYWRGGKYHEDVIEKKKGFVPVEGLLDKRKR